MSGWGSIYANTIYALQKQSTTIADLQRQISTGMRVAQASDDPGSAVKIMNLQQKSTSCDTYMANLEQASMTLENSMNSINQISTDLSRVRELIAQATSGVYSDANRESMAAEVDALIEQALSLVNTSSLGQYSFAGQTVTTTPYVAQRENGLITEVQYVGSLEEMYVPVTTETNFATQFVGEDVFSVFDPERPIFEGVTGAAVGTSPSTVRGDVWLTVADGGTTSYAAGPLAAGTSASQDTILGVHSISVDSAAMTVSLDGGPGASFTGTENDLVVTNDAGETVHVDMTAWAGGDGQWDVSRSATLSLDNGVTTTTVTDFSQQASVVDPHTGGVLMVDPSGIVKADVEAITVPGSYDLFGSLIHIRDLLANTRDLDSSRQQELLQQAGVSLSAVTDNLTQELSAVGSKIQALDSMTQTMKTNQNTVDDQTVMLQDADIVDVTLKIARSQNLYEMALTSASKLLSLSLLDFIQ